MARPARIEYEGAFYHLFMETALGNLSRAIQRLNGDYALYFSRHHKRPGHLFQGRFKAMLVEKEVYLLELSRYIYLFKSL